MKTVTITVALSSHRIVEQALALSAMRNRQVLATWPDDKVVAPPMLTPDQKPTLHFEAISAICHVAMELRGHLNHFEVPDEDPTDEYIATFQFVAPCTAQPLERALRSHLEEAACSRLLCRIWCEADGPAAERHAHQCALALDCARRLLQLAPTPIKPYRI